MNTQTKRISVTLSNYDYNELQKLSKKPSPSMSLIAQVAICSWLKEHKSIESEQLSLLLIEHNHED